MEPPPSSGHKSILKYEVTFNVLDYLFSLYVYVDKIVFYKNIKEEER